MPAVPISSITDAEKPIVAIRLRSFMPRSRSKVVFAFVMACYSVALASLRVGMGLCLASPKPAPSLLSS